MVKSDAAVSALGDPAAQERCQRGSRGAAILARLLLLATAALLASACIGGENFFVPGRVPKPTVRLGAMNFAEQQILAELYAGALEAGDYRVERQLGLGSRESVEPALEAGRIDLYVEYMATLLAFLTGDPTRGSSDPTATRRALEASLDPLGIELLDHAPAVNTNGFVVTQATAQRHRLSRLSDLARVGDQLTLGGPPECPVRPFCIPGLRQTYGISFRAFRIYDAGGPLTVAALEAGQVDVALLFTTDPLISARSFILLEDDRHLQLADNVAPVVRADFLKKTPPDFRAILNGVSAKLTTAELTRLNAQVSIEGRPAQEAARAWLKASELVR